MYKKKKRGKKPTKKAIISSSNSRPSRSVAAKARAMPENQHGLIDAVYGDGDSNSSSDLSETWSEVGAKLFSSTSKDQPKPKSPPVADVGPSSPTGSFNDDNRMDDFSNSEDNDDEYFNSCFNTTAAPPLPPPTAPQVVKKPLEFVKIEPEDVINENECYDNDNDDNGNQNDSDEDYMLPDTVYSDDDDDDNDIIDDSRESNNKSQNLKTRRSLRRVRSKSKSSNIQEIDENEAEDSDPEFKPVDFDFLDEKPKKKVRRKRTHIGRNQRKKRNRTNPQPRSQLQQPPQELTPYNYSDFQFHCDICDFHYENESYLSKHYQNHVDNMRCIGVSLGCTEIYQNIDDLKKHVESCSTAFQFRCSALKSINEKPILCLYLSCERSFAQIRLVLIHMKSFQFHFDENQVVNGQIPNPKFSCGICYNLFTNHRNLKNHIESQHPAESEALALTLPPKYSDFPFTCSICNFKYQTQDYLNRHYQYHLDGLRCIGYNLDCPVICESIDSLKEHLNTCLYAVQLKKSVMDNILEKPYICLLPECEKVYSCPDSVRRHMRAYHEPRERFAEKKNHDSEANKRFQCDFDGCSKCFKYESSLLRHEEYAHSAQKKAGIGGGQSQNIICHLCGHTFPKMKFLKDHFRLKHTEKKHACSFEGCGKAFVTFPRLKRHVKIHEKVQALPSDNTCTTCGAYFATNTGLYRHIRSHELESSKNYCCEICGTRYGHESFLIRHQKIHKIQLAARKEIYEKQIRLQNPQINDEEIAVMLLGWIDDRPLTRENETSEEKLVRKRLEMIDMIISKGLQKPWESIDDSLVRIKNEKNEKLKLKREMETDEEKAIRRSRYKVSFNSWKDRNSEKVKKYYNNYYKDYVKDHPEVYEKMKDRNRNNWAKLSAQKKAQRLEQMRNQSKKKRYGNDNGSFYS